jgi:hypothetical protein
VKGTIVLDVEAYDAAERAAAKKYSNRILQAFYPEMFATLGYPTRVEQVDQLWRYIDVMQETRTHYNVEVLLQGLTTEEFELFKRVTRVVEGHAGKRFGMRAHATAALTRAIHVLRLIKIATGSKRPTVLEVGPGCGYLAMLLVMEGYPYIGTDVVQAFYLYQSHMLSCVTKNLRELAAEDGDILTVEQPEPGTAIHIPWWKWITLTPEKVKLSAGIMTSNHVLCEMHPSSSAYMAVLGHRILSNHPGGGEFVFENWGYDLLHSRIAVARKFEEHGWRVCHDEDSMSAMVLADDVARWLGKPLPSVAPMVKSNAPIGWWPYVQRRVGAALGLIPPLKRVAIRAFVLVNKLFEPRRVPVVKGPGGSHPLSKRLTAGRTAVLARTTIRESEIDAFLMSHFGGAAPRPEDEMFFDLIGTRQ